MGECMRVVIHHRTMRLQFSSPPVNRHTRMHVQQVLRTRHRTTSIKALLSSSLSVRTKLSALSRNSTPLS
jgi:hypothetical protein